MTLYKHTGGFESTFTTFNGLTFTKSLGVELPGDLAARNGAPTQARVEVVLWVLFPGLKQADPVHVVRDPPGDVPINAHPLPDAHLRSIHGQHASGGEAGVVPKQCAAAAGPRAPLRGSHQGTQRIARFFSLHGIGYQVGRSIYRFSAGGVASLVKVSFSSADILSEC